MYKITNIQFFFSELLQSVLIPSFIQFKKQCLRNSIFLRNFICFDKVKFIFGLVMNKKLYLIDGMSLVFRAYHALFTSGLKTPSGEPSGAVFGFTNLLTSLIEKENPEYIAVIFDTSEPTFRHKLYPDYKANRSACPEDLVPQIPKIKLLLDYLNLPRFELHGFEADDLIGTYSKLASNNGFEVACVTSDKDFYQLVNDKVKLYKPGKRGEDFEIIDIDGVAEKFGVKPAQVIDVLAIIGDTSDNVPGVKGIGDKTAIPLVQNFGSLENIYENIEKIEKPAVKNKLIENKDTAFLSKTLVTIDTNITNEFSIEKFKFNTPDYLNLDSFFASQGFNTIRTKWRNKGIKDNFDYLGERSIFSESIEIKTNEIETIKDLKKDYIFVDSIEKLHSAVQELEHSSILSFDIETSSLDRDNCEIVGISFSAIENKAFYIPVHSINYHQQEVDLFNFDQKQNEVQWENSLPQADVFEVIKPLLENEKIGKCGQNVKFDMYILSRNGIDVNPIIFDSMVASYLIDPDQKHNMDALSQKWLNYIPISISSLIGEKKSKQFSMRDINPAEISDYACEDADVALKLKNVLEKEIEKNNLVNLAYNIEFPAIAVLTKMERNGVAIDSNALAELSSKIEIQSAELKKNIFTEAGIEFNIDSPKQLGHILFEKLMLPTAKKTKTGFSTDVEVLSELALTYPIANFILEYRTLMKLKSTYIDALPKLVNPKTNRIHTTFNQTVASTGRLSSTDPNLQNIPVRTELGREIRRAFVSGNKDNLILSADYSQIELRIMASMCKDEKMIDSFKKGLDIHSTTASVLFGNEISDVNSDQRRIAKTVNFGIMYGLGSFGLSQRLAISRNEAKRIIDNYFAKYPGIKKYMDDTIHFTQQNGFAQTLMGRRRFFTDINSKNNNLKTAAERAAINMPIQGTASDMMKIAMVNIDREMTKLKMKSKMLIQVHDEFVFEVDRNEIDEMKQLVTELMQSALPLGEVPVVAEVGIGENWFEAH